jgi:hypothetical protein
MFDLSLITAVLLLLSVSVSIEVNQQQAGIVHTTATH